MLTIREVSEADAADIAAIYRPVVEDSTISFEVTAPDDAEMARRIYQNIQEYPWFVASEEEAIIGYAYASKHRERTAYVSSVDVSVYVGENARGRGIGTKLYAMLFHALERRKFHRMFAGIALPNEASIALHKKYGFELVGTYREVGRKFDRWLDVAWYQRGF